jgi:hypothetical protein
MPDWLRLVLAVFACYRLSELITIDDGPGDMFLRLRAWFGAYNLGEDGQPSTSIGRVIICQYCVGIWIAAALSFLFPVSLMTPLYWFAIAGGQAFLQSVGGRNGQ